MTGVAEAKAYEVAHLDDLARIPVEEGLEWRPIRRRFGIESFGTNAYTSAHEGGWVVEEHKESSGHEELYIVISGHAKFTLGGEDVDAPVGTVVFLPEGDVQRKAVSEESGTTVLALGGWPEKPFAPSAWEWFFEAYAQEPGQAVETMEDGLERFRGKPQEAVMLYHLACIESLAGRTEEAREHIAQAIELNPDLRERAETDDDIKELV